MDIPDYLTSTLPLFSLRVRGKWKKDVIFQVIKGKQIVRNYTDYDGSAKTHLVQFQSKFAEAVFSWQALPAVSKRWYNAREAKLGLRISGYNFYISLYLRDKLDGLPG